MNIKINWFFSLFKILLLKLKYGKKILFRGKNKILQSDIFINSSKSSIIFGVSTFLEKNSIIKADGGKIMVGNNVWIGGNSIILPGVRIGNNAIIDDSNISAESVFSSSRVDSTYAKSVDVYDKSTTDSKFGLLDQQISNTTQLQLLENKLNSIGSAVQYKGTVATKGELLLLADINNFLDKLPLL